MKFDLYQAVADLRASWPGLPDVDRAQAILAFQRQLRANNIRKMSGRTLSAALGCQESLLRHISPLTRATAAEKHQAREREISTRKLRKIVLEREAAERAQLEEAELAKEANAAEKGAKDILAFFQKERILPPYAETIWNDALALLRRYEESGPSENVQRPKGMSSADIASRCWPAFAPNGDTTIAYINCCALWLARWTLRAMPNAIVREQAYRLAWSKIIKGYSVAA